MCLNRSVIFRIRCADGLSFITDIRVLALLVYIVGDELGDYKRLLLSCATLKNADKQGLPFLQRQCPEEGVHVYLAKLITSIDYDTAINNRVADTAMELQPIIDLDGHVSVKKKL